MPAAAPSDVSVVHVILNTFTPKPGMAQAFIDAQCAGLAEMRGRIDGLLGSRLYQAIDDDVVVLESVFATAQAAERFRGSALFAAHRARIAPYLVQAAPRSYRRVYAYGDL